MIRQLAFEKRVIENGAVSLVPKVDGTALTEIVAEFEARFDDRSVAAMGALCRSIFGSVTCRSTTWVSRTTNGRHPN